jgi:hypothetical protein
MTRRYIIFYDEVNGFYYSTPEFNGDKSELESEKSMDSCKKDWPEIVREFTCVDTLEKFKAASDKAQRHYHSFLGDTPPYPVMQTGIVHIGATGIGHNLWQAGEL